MQHPLFKNVGTVPVLSQSFDNRGERLCIPLSIEFWDDMGIVPYKFYMRDSLEFFQKRCS